MTVYTLYNITTVIYITLDEDDIVVNVDKDLVNKYDIAVNAVANKDLNNKDNE